MKGHAFISWASGLGMLIVAAHLGVLGGLSALVKAASRRKTRRDSRSTSLP